jgi:cellobiose phosphorylase
MPAQLNLLITYFAKFYRNEQQRYGFKQISLMNSFVFLKITSFSQDLLCWHMQTKMLNGKELYCFEQVFRNRSAAMKVIQHYPTLVPNKYCLFYTNNLTLKQ